MQLSKAMHRGADRIGQVHKRQNRVFLQVSQTGSLDWRLTFVLFQLQSESFQVDLYPPTPGPTPALSADEWMCGIDKDPIRLSMKVRI